MFLKEIGSIIRAHDERMSELKKLEENTTMVIRDKIKKMKYKTDGEYCKAMDVVDVILSLESQYSNILYNIYIRGKREKEVEAYEGRSSSTTNRSHSKAIELFIKEYFKRENVI